MVRPNRQVFDSPCQTSQRLSINRYLGWVHVLIMHCGRLCRIKSNCLRTKSFNSTTSLTKVLVIIFIAFRMRVTFANIAPTPSEMITDIVFFSLNGNR